MGNTEKKIEQLEKRCKELQIRIRITAVGCMLAILALLIHLILHANGSM